MRILLAACLLLASGPAAGGSIPKLGRVQTLSIALQTSSPSFYARYAPRLVDRERLLYLGHGVQQEQARLRLLELASGKERWVEVPLARYLAAHAEDFGGAAGSGWPTLAVQRLLFYDSGTGQAGLLVQQRYGRRRELYLHWDLRAGRIVRHAVIGEVDARRLWHGVEPIAYHPQRGELYLQVLTGVNDAGPHGASPADLERPRAPARAPRAIPQPKATSYEVRVLAVTAARERTLTRFDSARKLFPGPYVDRAHDQALLVEYAERSAGGARPPQGHLVDLQRGARRPLAIPLTCYGASFSADGRRLYAYSSQTGELWEIGLAAGKKQRAAKLPQRGWVLGAPGADRYQLLVHPKGISVVDTRSLTVVRRVPRARFGKGFFHVEGSSIAPGLLVIRNGSTVHVVRAR